MASRSTHAHRLFHRSAAVLVALVAAGFAPAQAAPPPVNAADPATTGRALLNRTLDAHGGLERFRSYGTLTYRTEGLPFGEAPPLNFDHVADLDVRRHRMEGAGSRGAFVAAANDRGAWATDAEALGAPPRWITHGQSYFVMMPFVFADPGTHVRDLGEREFGGQTYRALAVGFSVDTGDTPRDDYVLYIDPQTDRLRLVDFIVSYGPIAGDTPIAELPRRSIEFVSWQQTDGLLVPAELHYAPWQRTEGGGLRAATGVRYTVSGVDFETPRPDASLFAEPGDNAADERHVATPAAFANTRYGTERIDGVDVFYREAGRVGAPQIVLLHGFPTSSHMFHDLIPMLADDFHILAPDYPGFGLSSAPAHNAYDYTFDNLASVVDTLLQRKGFDRYVLYVMDYGAPVGYRIATAHPERVRGLVVQNGNAYEEGLREFWEPLKAYWAAGIDARAERDALRPFVGIELTKWQWLAGVREPDQINPDNWLVTQPLLDRPGNVEVQLDLFFDYGSNPPLYPAWQRYFREHRPSTLIVWGQNDPIFPAEGAHPYLRDLPDAELHLFDTGHFALEEDGQEIGELITDFVKTRTTDRAD